MKIFHSKQHREIFLSKLQVWRPRRKFKKKILFCYKEYPYDHSLYALLLYFKINYVNMDFVEFLPEERPRENPGLSSKKLFQKIDTFKPDVIFAYEKILSFAEIDHIRDMGIELLTSTCGYSSYSYGGMSRMDALESLAKHSLYLVPHAPHIPNLRSAGVNAVEFPFWFEPGWFHPLKKAKSFDILFAGDFTTPLNRNRLALLELLSKDHKVVVVSDKNPSLPNIHYLGSTTDPYKLNEWINLSRIVIGSDRLAEKKSLNDPARRDLFAYDDEFFIRQRTYLTMGAGVCYFVERHDEIEKKFINGAEIVLWDHDQDLIDKIRYFLENHTERNAIAAKGAEKALTEHSTAVRVAQLVQMM
jgi:hypothetical protein